MLNKKESPAKIGFLIPSMTWGGAELQLINALALFGQQEYDTYLMVTGTELELLDRTNLPPHKILCLKNENLNFLTSKSIYPSVSTAWRTMCYLRQHNVRILIAQLPLSHWIARWATVFSWAALFPIKILLYHHSEQFSANPAITGEMKVFHKVNMILGFLCDHTHIFISNSSYVDFKKNQFVRNPHIIHNFTKETVVSDQQARIYLAAKGKSTFDQLLVVPGRLHTVKGQMFFLKAMDIYLTKEKMKEGNILLVFAGGGPAQEAIQKKLEDMGIANFSLITGFIENELLLSFLKLSNLVIIPSLFEGLGNVAIESLMLRCKILCSDAGGLKEVIGTSQAAVVFKAGHAEDLQNKLKSILNGQAIFDPESGYQWYQNNFTPEIHLGKWRAILEKM